MIHVSVYIYPVIYIYFIHLYKCDYSQYTHLFVVVHVHTDNIYFCCSDISLSNWWRFKLLTMLTRWLILFCSFISCLDCFYINCSFISCPDCIYIKLLPCIKIFWCFLSIWRILWLRHWDRLRSLWLMATNMTHPFSSAILQCFFSLMQRHFSDSSHDYIQLFWFCRFFMEKQVMGVFVRILKVSRTLIVALQLLQTMGIMIQNLRNEHSICKL